MSHESPPHGGIAPERWYGEKLGHLSRHDREDLLRAEVRALCENVRRLLNVFAIRKSFLNAGGTEEHWRRISACLSELHPRESSDPPEPVVRIPASSEGGNGGRERPARPSPRQDGGPGAGRDKETPPPEDCYKQLGKTLVARGAITQRDLDRALQQQLQTGERLGSILVGTGAVDPHELAQALATRTGLLAVDLDLYPIEPAAAEVLPVELCEQHCMLPLKVAGDIVLLAMGNPSDADAYTASREALAGKQIRRVVAAEMQIEKLLRERKNTVGARR